MEYISIHFYYHFFLLYPSLHFIFGPFITFGHRMEYRVYNRGFIFAISMDLLCSMVFKCFVFIKTEDDKIHKIMKTNH